MISEMSLGQCMNYVHFGASETSQGSSFQLTSPTSQKSSAKQQQRLACFNLTASTTGDSTVCHITNYIRKKINKENRVNKRSTVAKYNSVEILFNPDCWQQTKSETNLLQLLFSVQLKYLSEIITSNIF